MGNRHNQLLQITLGLALLTALCLFTGFQIFQRAYAFHGRLPDAQTLNLRQDEPYNDVDDRSLLSLTACVENDPSPLRRRERVYVLSSTRILDQRGRLTPITATADILHPGQIISVKIVDSAIFGGVIAAEITVQADDTPAPCRDELQPSP